MFDKIGSWELINTVLPFAISVEEIPFPLFSIHPSRASHSFEMKLADIRE